MICRFGAQQAILSDRGTNFCADLFKEFARLFGIRTCKTTAYHPQTNGSLEKSHQNLTEYLRAMIEEDDNWDEWIPRAMLSYNASVRESTRYCPHELVYGIKPHLPSERNLGGLGGRPYAEILSELGMGLEQKRAEGRVNLINSKHKSKKYYDKRIRPIVINPGNSVWLYQKPRIGKRQNKYKDPYRVEQILENNNEVIRTERDTRTVHRDKIKKANLNNNCGSVSNSS